MQIYNLLNFKNFLREKYQLFYPIHQYSVIIYTRGYQTFSIEGTIIVLALWVTQYPWELINSAFSLCSCRQYTNECAHLSSNQQAGAGFDTQVCGLSIHRHRQSQIILVNTFVQTQIEIFCFNWIVIYIFKTVIFKSFIPSFHLRKYNKIEMCSNLPYYISLCQMYYLDCCCNSSHEADFIYWTPFPQNYWLSSPLDKFQRIIVIWAY
jgi:hypothetical protein